MPKTAALKSETSKCTWIICHPVKKRTCGYGTVDGKKWAAYPRVSTEEIGLPPRPFLYTLDQSAALLYVELRHFQKRYCYYEGRSVGPCYPDLMRCTNIAPRGAPPDWRVNEQELKRFLKRLGFRWHERKWNA